MEGVYTSDKNYFSFSEQGTCFATLPTILSPEVYEEDFGGRNVWCDNDVAQCQENVAVVEQSDPVQSEIEPVVRKNDEKLLPSVSSFSANQRIRYRNRDYYGLPVRASDIVKDGGGAELLNGGVKSISFGGVTTENGRKKRKYTKRRNPLSTMLTVKNLKKLLETQDDGVTPQTEVKHENDAAPFVHPPTKSEYFVADRNLTEEEDECAAAVRAINGETVEPQENGYHNRMQLNVAEVKNVRARGKTSKRKVAVVSVNSSNVIAKRLVRAVAVKSDKAVQSRPKNRNFFRNRAYEFESLQIGSFTAVTTRENIKQNKMRFYFSQKQVVYDFKYDYVTGYNSNSMANLSVMIFVHLDSIEQAVFRSRGVEFLLNKPPRIVSGLDRNKLPAYFKCLENFTQPTTVDVTNGQLSVGFLHRINLPRAQGHLIEKHLLEFKPTLKKVYV